LREKTLVGLSLLGAGVPLNQFVNNHRKLRQLILNWKQSPNHSLATAGLNDAPRPVPASSQAGFGEANLNGIYA